MTSADLDAAVAATLDTLDDSALNGEVKVRAAPYIAALPCSALMVDHSYQRELNRGRVADMAAEFDVSLLGVIEVADRGDGRFAVLEGQHRFRAALAAKGADHHMVCQVHTGLSVEDEARLFYEIDRRRKALSPWDKWKARRSSGDETVIDVEAVVAEAGMRVHMTAAPGSIRSTASLERLYADGGRPLLTSVLAITGQAYGDQQDAYDGHLLLALGEILRAYRPGTELDTNRLADALSAVMPRQLKARAALQRELTPGTMPRLVATVIIGAYNQRPGRKLEPFAERAKPGRPIADRRES